MPRRSRGTRCSPGSRFDHCGGVVRPSAPCGLTEWASTDPAYPRRRRRGGGTEDHRRRRPRKCAVRGTSPAPPRPPSAGAASRATGSSFSFERTRSNHDYRIPAGWSPANYRPRRAAILGEWRHRASTDPASPGSAIGADTACVEPARSRRRRRGDTFIALHRSPRRSAPGPAFRSPVPVLSRGSGATVPRVTSGRWPALVFADSRATKNGRSGQSRFSSVLGSPEAERRIFRSHRRKRRRGDQQDLAY